MGLGKERNRVRKAISGWRCFSYFGYGHGRAVHDFDERHVRGRSVCIDLCPKGMECRLAHHARMDQRFPAVAGVVRRTAREAVAQGKPVVQSVIAAMHVAEREKVEGVAEIRRRLTQFKVHQLTDHYLCGQFENIQNGLDGLPPTHERPLPEGPKQDAVPDTAQEKTA